MKLKRSIMAIFVIQALISAVPASAEYVPRLYPERNLADVGELAEPIPVERMIEAAVRASGTVAGDIGRVVEDIASLLRKAESVLDTDAAPDQLAESILGFLHEHVFTVYDEFQTRIDVAMSSGRFNCVSSAVLYMIVARHFDITVVGVGTADHAFCAVVLPDRKVDVETTTVHGFDPGQKKEFQDAFGNVTGYSYVPPSDYSGRSEIGERELLALILQNRISVLENQKKYAEAVPLAVDRYALAPGEVTRDHLFRELGNYAALLNERKEYSRALEFLEDAVSLYGWEESVRGIHEILHYNVAIALLQGGKPREAISSVNASLEGGWMDAASAATLRSQAAERILARELPELEPREGLHLVDSLLSEGLLAENRHLEYSVMFYSRLAEEQAAKKSYLGAAAIIDNAISELGSDTRLVRARSAYRYNYAVEIHNEFAAMFNDKKYSEARDLVLKALEAVPESDILNDDLAIVRKVLSGTN